MQLPLKPNAKLPIMIMSQTPIATNSTNYRHNGITFNQQSVASKKNVINIRQKIL